jgi:hypothetical protein
VQRIPLSDEYDPDADVASDVGDPLDVLDRYAIPLTTEERRALPSIIGHEAEIAVARRNRVKTPTNRPSRKHGC